MTKREFLDKVFALAPIEANAIMDAFDEYVDSNEPHWIPCSERLPKESGTYLITVKRLPVITKFFSVEGDGWGKGCWNDVVTAWMSMPERYEESEVKP